MTYLRDLLRGDSKELFYSFAQGLGADNAGLFGYYLLSPYNLLLLFSSVYNVPYWFEIIQALKIASCGLTMCFFLKQKGKYNRSSNKDVLIIILSTLYAMSGFNVSQIMNIMWLDGAVLLPLVSLAILRLIYDSSLWTFYLTILLSLVSCFYTGYMIVIYSVVFFLFEILRAIKCDDNNKYLSHCIKILIDFFMSLFTAAGSSAIFILPIYYDLKLSKLGNPDEIQISYAKFGEAVIWYLLFNIILFLIWGVFRKRYQGRFSGWISSGMTIAYIGISWKVMNYIANKGIYDKDVIATPLKLLIGTFNVSELRDGLPNIYIGTIGVIFLILIILGSKGIDKEEISYTSWLTLVGIFSVIGFIPINMLFHGGSVPAGSNYRWSFILCFVLLLFISEHLETMQGIRRNFYGIWPIFIIVGILVVGIHIYRQSNMDFLNAKIILLSGIFAVIYVTILFLGMRVTKLKKILKVLLILVICLEMSVNLYFSQLSFDNLENSDYTDVIDMSKQMSNIIDGQTDGHNAVYRVEIATWNKWDYVWRQNGISSYSSVLPYSNVSFLEQFGMKSKAMNNKATCNNLNLDSKLASLLGIRYILSDDELDTAKWVPIGEVTGDEGLFTLFRNQDVLPMCFAIDRNNTYSSINEIASDFDEIKNNFRNLDNNLIVSGISEYSIDVNIEKDSKLVFMIPYTEGWIVKVDGIETDYFKECDFYMGIDISSGNHKIVLQYVPPFLKLGSIISVISILAFVFYAIYRKKHIKAVQS